MRWKSNLFLGVCVIGISAVLMGCWASKNTNAKTGSEMTVEKTTTARDQKVHVSSLSAEKQAFSIQLAHKVQSVFNKPQEDVVLHFCGETVVVTPQDLNSVVSESEVALQTNTFPFYVLVGENSTHEKIPVLSYKVPAEVSCVFVGGTTDSFEQSGQQITFLIDQNMDLDPNGFFNVHEEPIL